MPNQFRYSMGFFGKAGEYFPHCWVILFSQCAISPSAHQKEMAECGAEVAPLQEECTFPVYLVDFKCFLLFGNPSYFFVWSPMEFYMLHELESYCTLNLLEESCETVCVTALCLSVSVDPPPTWLTWVACPIHLQVIGDVMWSFAEWKCSNYCKLGQLNM